MYRGVLLETTAVCLKIGGFPIFRQRTNFLGACFNFSFIALWCNRIISGCFMKSHVHSVDKKL